jgi:hypothetical protein
MTNEAFDPVAIGGIGGSGTRLAALLLRLLGCYLGDDLNGAMDNLWFTLLFKRQSVLVETGDALRRLTSLFFSRMAGIVEISQAERTLLLRLASRDRPQHSRDWLRQRVISFCDGNTSYRANQMWGWKEPNTHVVIDRIFQATGDLKYIHIVRHPIDMALSANQNQLRNWGPTFLDRAVEIEPRDSLSYWCAVHRRIMNIRQTWPQRVMIIYIEALSAEPELFCREIAQFCRVGISDSVISSFQKLLQRRATLGRYQAVDPRKFEPADLEYLAQLGYNLP